MEGTGPWIGLATFGTSVGTGIGIAVMNAMRRKDSDASITKPLKEEDQKQQRIIEEQTREIAALKQENAELRARQSATDQRLSFIEKLLLQLSGAQKAEPAT